MKPMTLQPTSLLVGAAFALLTVVAMGQKSVPVATVGFHHAGPDKEYVQIDWQVPYTVPAQMRFIATMSTDSTGRLTVNGVDIIDFRSQQAGYVPRNLGGTLVFEPGDTVTMSYGLVFGYLERATVARDYIMITEAADYTVPAGKFLRLTAYGQDNLTVESGLSRLDITVDGALMVNPPLSAYSGPYAVQQLPEGLVASDGQVVSLSLPVGNGLAWGFLVDE